MSYTLKNGRTEFRGGINILASRHLQWTEHGITLDAEKTGKTYLPVGTPVARNLETGKYEVYADGEGGAAPEGYDDFALLNIDVEVDGENDVIIGEVLIRASVYEAKLPDTVTETFKKLTSPLIRYVKHV
ncbi:hypothetical protein [Shouchella tritolerans]|uniref:hypothetical protein n=1 Tax=Shouchella tritolerans TaxID=2979466 RepID=UPI0021E90BD9|nr:hypothetical protein [Shouchella tritolerans]